MGDGYEQGETSTPSSTTVPQTTAADAKPHPASPAGNSRTGPTDGLLPPATIIRHPTDQGQPPTVARDYFVETEKPMQNGNQVEDFLAAPGHPSAEKLKEDGDDATAPETSSRRSVQFARPKINDPATHTRHESLDGLETPGRAKGASFMSRIKAMAGTSGLQTPRSPIANSFEPPAPITTDSHSGLADGSYDADADAELTADEANIPGPEGSKRKKKRRMRRPRKEDRAEPETPSRLTHDPDTPGTSRGILRRRASMPDTSARNGGLSDDELTRNRHRPSLWRRGTPWMEPIARAQSDDNEDPEPPYAVARRLGHFRRSSALAGGGVSDGDGVVQRRPLFNSERASTYGVHKWRQVKNTLKLLRQKKEDRFDYYKSAELMAELRAGAPAVLMLASMIQRDEHGNKRIPVLLEQLKLRVVDSYPEDVDENSNRHWYFVFELEYGSGPSRMNWTITRSLGDLYNLHFRYKFTLKNEKYIPGRLDLGARHKQPKFPYSAFPYMRQARDKRDKGDSSESDDQGSIMGDEPVTPRRTSNAIPEEGEGTATAASDAEGPHGHQRRRSRMNIMGMRRRSTGITDPGDASNTEGPFNPAIDPALRRQRYIEKQRRVLEKYLSEMIRWLMFRAESNRLCRFLELSALGVRLAAEGSYHGKEGFLHIQSSKGLDFRRVLTPAKVIARHSSKWFLVRQSYIVCVESPENMNIYDVYLVDSKFNIISKRGPQQQLEAQDDQNGRNIHRGAATAEKHHTLTLATSERQVRLFSRNHTVMQEFEASINEMLRQTPWYENKRFDSFSPVRHKVFAQWLVDGRDYMWNVSRAINMARDVIYIHDWWLSPELYMRRPAAISQKWRLDRLLQKKAREGVKIFVIMYRNVEAAIPIDSEYTKFSLLNLHPNIFVQRSPNQFKKNQFFFAHHEKICIVDHDVAFVGGIDLCFGRWDCPQHPITDDKPTGFEPSDTLPKDADHCQLYPGKDYSNPRVQDFFRLNEPYEEMYDRSKVPRMPWHDVGMQVVGQPARDLTRHFVQRWNYLRRGRKPTRPLPFLLPAPDANMEELEELGLTGTCEVQILRSATTWSLGIEGTEHSIQTAYIKMIEDSDHFVYIENQFFISSTDVYGTRITNRIGDALVDRIIRAHQNEEDWRCIIIIPLMPGFQNTVDEQEGTSVRLILMCQYRSICRGESSIFGRLRAVGIDPEDYINFYSLRQWGVMASDCLVTEQLYIHAKTIIVDDRVALIGSANINERSMLGTRDSECAAVVRDTDLIWSTMAGKPYQVGRFAHTLRMRLMREHLGLDVDEIMEQERQQDMDREAFEAEMDQMYAERTGANGESSNAAGHPSLTRLPSFNAGLDLEQAAAIGESDSDKGKEPETDLRVTNESHQMDLSGYGRDQWKSAERSGLSGGRDSVIVNGREILVHDTLAEGRGTLDSPKPPHTPQSPGMSETRAAEAANGASESMPPMPPFNRRTTEQLGLPRTTQLPALPVVDDTDIGGPPVHIDPATGRPGNTAVHPMAADIKLAHIDKNCMRDPVNANFIDDIWHRSAANNTKLYRRVFRCMPDSEVSTWAEYREYVDYGERFRASMEGRPQSEEPDTKSEDPHGGSSAAAVSGPETTPKVTEKEGEKLSEKLPKLPASVDETAEFNEKQPADGTREDEKPQRGPMLDIKVASDQRATAQDAPSPVYPPGDTPFPAMDQTQAKSHELQPNNSSGNNKKQERRTTFSTLEKPPSKDASCHTHGNHSHHGDSVKKRRRATTKGSRRGFTIEDMPTRTEAEELMNITQGHLVQFPYDWLLTEEHNGNWGYQVDGVAPLAIYN